MQTSDKVLPVYQQWQNNQIQGRFVIKEKEQQITSGQNLFELINSSRPVSSGEIPKNRGINTSNTFSAPSTSDFTPKLSGTGSSSSSNLVSPVIPQLERSGTLEDVRLRHNKESISQHLKLIEERRYDLLDKKKKLLALLADYSKKLATPLDESTMQYYQDNIRKANMGITTIEEKLTELDREKRKITNRKSLGMSMPSSTDGSPRNTLTKRGSQNLVLPLPTNTRFIPEQSIENSIIFPEQMKTQLSLDGKNPFEYLLGLIQKQNTPDIQEKALRLIGNLCQIAENQPILLKTKLLLILLYLIENQTFKSTPNVIKLSCWILASLSSLESNKILIDQANGIPILLQTMKSEISEISDQASNVLTNILNSRNIELHNSFRTSNSFEIANEILSSPITKIAQKTNILRLIILLGLTIEDKKIIASNKYQFIESIMKLLTESETSKKLSIMLLSAVSSIEESRKKICKSKEFSILLKTLNDFNDLRLLEKTLLIINNLALSEDDLLESFKYIIPIMQNSSMDEKLKIKSVQCISNLVLIDEEHLECFYDFNNSIEGIIEFLQNSNEIIWSSTIRLLVNITHGSGLANFIREELGQKKVIYYLSLILRNINNNDEIEEQILKAFVNISLSYLNEDDYIQSKIIPLLLKYFSSSSSSSSLLDEGNNKDLKKIEYAIATLVNITRRSDKIREQVRESNGLIHLLNLCNSSNHSIQIYSFKAITNLALNGKNRYFFQNSSPFLCKIDDLISSSDISSDLNEAASLALRNIKFPCEDYSKSNDNDDNNNHLNSSSNSSSLSNNVNDSSTNSSSNLNVDVEKLIEETVLQLDHEDAITEIIAPLSKHEALERVRSTRTLAPSIPDDDLIDNLLSEITAEDHQLTTNLSVKKNDDKDKDDKKPPLSSLSKKPALPSFDQLQLEFDSLGDMENLVSMQVQPTPRTAAKLLREENERLIAEQRKLLEDERKKFEEERKKFEEEREKINKTTNSTDEKSSTTTSTTSTTTPKQEVQEVPEIDKAKEEKYHNKRTKIAVEILVTERSYVDSLNTMVNKYMNPMHSLALTRKPVIKTDQVYEIFTNVEEIISYHTMLLEGLERRVSKFDGNTCLGEFFISMVIKFIIKKKMKDKIFLRYF